MSFKKLNEAQITAKCVEVGKCLIGVAPGLVTMDLGVSQTIGDAARFAVSIRNRADLLQRESLAGISTALKIDFRIAESKILPLYETLGWVTIKHSGSRIDSITENIPPTQDILSVLGTKWREDGPSIIDEATLTSLAELSKRPFSREALLSELAIKEKDFETAYEYGEQAGYFGKFVSENNETEAIWTPFYWANNIEHVLKFLKSQSEPKLDKIGELAAKFKQHPGVPDDKIDTRDKSLVDGGIASGFFPAVKVADRQGKAHGYIFAASPQFGIENNTDVFEKARMIVSCIRHGQYHAEISRVLYPKRILEAMRTNTMKPHPYANVQYAILVLHGIIKLEPSATRYGRAYKVVWIDTPENNLAADIAKGLLSGDEIVSGTKEELEAKEVLVQGMFDYSSEQRRLKMTHAVTAKREFDRLMDLMSGVKV